MAYTNASTSTPVVPDQFALAHEHKKERHRRELKQPLTAKLATNGEHVALSWKMLNLLQEEFNLTFNDEAQEEPGMSDVRKHLQAYFQPKMCSTQNSTQINLNYLGGDGYPGLFCVPGGTKPSPLANVLTRMIKEVTRLRNLIKLHITNVYFIFGFEEMLSSDAIAVRDAWVRNLRLYTLTPDLKTALGLLEIQYPLVFNSEIFPESHVKIANTVDA
jgi:hypothetical protein